MRIVLTLVALSKLLSQEVAPVSLKVDVNLVNLAFVAHGSSGALARDLTADDIEIYEDGVKQKVKFFSRSAEVPLLLGIVVDASESQGKFLKAHHRDLQSFIATSLAPRDRALLICFGDHVRLVSDFTSSAEELMASLDEYQKRTGGFPELDPDKTREGGTALFDALYATADQKMRPASGERKAIILFSDGEDNSSAHDLVDAIGAAQAADSFIYSIRYTETKHGRLTARNHYGTREMNRFAEETGGLAFDASHGHVEETLAQIAAELRAIYEVGYTSSNPARDGEFRKVVVKSVRDGVVIRAKPGYYAR